MSMTIAVIVSLLIGLAAAGLGFWDRHKINTINGQIASIDSSVPATSIIAPTTGQTLSGTVSLDALPYGNHFQAVQFVATGGSSRNVLIANGIATYAGWGAQWKSTNLPNGTYQISSIGYNTSGRSSRSPAVTVFINNP
jgi:Bacterial Ig domain